MIDQYKVNMIDKAIEGMKSNDYCLTRLWSEAAYSKAINLDIEILEIIKSYYEGKTIKVMEDKT